MISSFDIDERGGSSWRQSVTTQLAFNPSPFNDDHRPFMDIAPDNGLPPLVLMHGFLMSRAVWNDNIEGLSSKARLVRLELLAHGRSPTPLEESAYQLDNYVETLEALREHLGYRQWTLCAHSLGAALALNYAIARPGSISGIVFTNSTAGLGRLQDRASSALGEDFREGLRQGRSELLLQMNAHARNMRYVSDQVKEALLKDSELLNPVGIERNLRFLEPFIGIRDKDANFPMPVLLVNGRRERQFQPFKDDALERYPDWHYAELDGGHSINAQMPDAFNALVIDFLKNVVAAARSD